MRKKAQQGGRGQDHGRLPGTRANSEDARPRSAGRRSSGPVGHGASGPGLQLQVLGGIPAPGSADTPPARQAERSWSWVATQEARLRRIGCLATAHRQEGFEPQLYRPGYAVEATSLERHPEVRSQAIATTAAPQRPRPGASPTRGDHKPTGVDSRAGLDQSAEASQPGPRPNRGHGVVLRTTLAITGVGSA